MRVFRIIIATVMLVLVPAFAASAADIFSPAVSVLTATQLFQCLIVNVGSGTEFVEIHVFNASGTEIGNLSRTLGPGEVGGFDISFSLLGYAYCKFIVQGSKNNFRASIVLRDGLSILAALPAD